MAAAIKPRTNKTINRTFILFDNEGETYDRYSAFNIKDKSVYGFSSNPYHPLGVGQYCGDFTVSKEEIEKSSHLGKSIKAEDLNETCLMFLLERL